MAQCHRQCDQDDSRVTQTREFTSVGHYGWVDSAMKIDVWGLKSFHPVS